MNRSLLIPLMLLLGLTFYLFINPPDNQEHPLITTSKITELIKTDNRIGEGNLAIFGKKVTVHYSGWLYDDNKPDHRGIKFDSSRDRSEPFAFQLGTGKVIMGWDHGILGMKVGGQRTLIIPPDLGYGSRRASRLIPPNSTLIFDVELLQVD